MVSNLVISLKGSQRSLTCVAILHHFHAATMTHSRGCDRGSIERIAASLVLLAVTIEAVDFAI